MKQNKRVAPSFNKFKATSDVASNVMRKNRPKDTSTELILRRVLWHQGLRYRLHVKELPGKPDIVFIRRRIAIFIDGDFWHGRDWHVRKRKLKKGSNSKYWIKKIKYNIDRDKRNTLELEKQGWKVIRFWEMDIKYNIQDAVCRVKEALLRAKPTLQEKSTESRRLNLHS